MYLLFLILAGILQGAMVSLNAQLGNYYSLYGVCFFVHVIAAIILIVYLVGWKKTKIRLFGVPKYIYTVGFMGVIIVATSSWCTLKIGATAMTSLSVIGQMLSSALIDHFGWFGAEKRAFSCRQLPCYALVLAGILLVVNG